MCELKDFEKLQLDENHRLILQGELEIWHQTYLPVGKTVLDLGAGCGETAQFYINHGAEKVISIEADPTCFDKLRANFINDRRVVPILAHIDSIKCDIEGGERDMVIETHFPFKLRRVHTLMPNVVIWKLREDWGNVATKAVRKTKTWLNSKQ